MLTHIVGTWIHPSKRPIFNYRFIATKFAEPSRLVELGRIVLWLSIMWTASAGNAGAAAGTYAEACLGPRGCGNVDSGTLHSEAGAIGDDGEFRSGEVVTIADPGRLSVFATATNTGSIGSLSMATGVVGFTDRITVEAGSGISFVDLVLRVILHGTCEATDGAFGGKPNATCGVGISLNRVLTLDSAGDASLTTTVANHSVIGIESELAVSGYATHGKFTGDFRNTGEIFVYSLTPGVTLVSESGHNYLPVPEPASYALMFAGIGVVGLVSRKRSSAIAN